MGSNKYKKKMIGPGSAKNKAGNVGAFILNVFIGSEASIRNFAGIPQINELMKVARPLLLCL